MWQVVRVSGPYANPEEVAFYSNGPHRTDAYLYTGAGLRLFPTSCVSLLPSPLVAPLSYLTAPTPFLPHNASSQPQ